jgi:hypothetical protein
MPSAARRAWHLSAASFQRRELSPGADIHRQHIETKFRQLRARQRRRRIASAALIVQNKVAVCQERSKPEIEHQRQAFQRIDARTAFQVDDRIRGRIGARAAEDSDVEPHFSAVIGFRAILRDGQPAAFD